MRGLRVGVFLCILVLAWKGLSIGNPTMFPPPERVFELSYTLSTEGDIRGTSALVHLWHTLLRVFVATAVAIGLGVGLAVSMWRNDVVEQVLEFWLPIWMTPPDVIVILITMVLIGFNSTAVVVAVSFVYTPFALVTLWGGMQDIDGDLIEMANTFESPQLHTWRHIYLPYLSSYIFSALRTVFGMTWKVAVIAEVLGVNSGVGAQIRFWYTQGEISYILAYTMLFIAVVLLIEYGVLGPLQKRLFVWRREASA